MNVFNFQIHIFTLSNSFHSLLITGSSISEIAPSIMVSANCAVQTSQAKAKAKVNEILKADVNVSVTNAW